ncbi:hypothetical protein [Criibacterium bergeronii]|uniref:Uncharacterized protein n=1 Tax=Criibacterium bergeronii TaxID=1871336 RepID=A0A371ILE8_9FIRM|nr:hypothetical protein [Criibacterium bergeronii]RDY21276.1 hypothetical protein BBG48_005705 [Criibacterium bergeronii]
MKRMFVFLSTLLIVFAFSISAFASDLSSNVENEVMDISDEIVTVVNEIYENRDIKVTAEDIDYSKAYKVYVDTNIFRLSTNKADKIKETLETENYIYLLPIDVSDGTIVVNLQKGLPLSENSKKVLSLEEQQEVLDNVGKWIVSSVYFYENGNLNFDYERKLKSLIGVIPEGTMLVGSLPIFEDVVALIPNEDGIIESIVPLSTLTKEKDLINYSTKNNSYIYSYKQIKEIANDLPDEDPNIAGEAANIETDINYIMIAFSVVLTLVIVAYMFYLKKKKINE